MFALYEYCYNTIQCPHLFQRVAWLPGWKLHDLAWSLEEMENVEYHILNKYIANTYNYKD